MAVKKKPEGYLKINIKEWETKKSLILVDVSSVMRTWYIPTEQSSFGFRREPLKYEVNGVEMNTSAIFGFFKVLVKYGLQHDFIFCFDLPYGNMLKEIDSTYKANRVGNKPANEYYQQVNIVKSILEETGYQTAYEPKLEGDHLIFASAETNYDDYEKIGVITNDKDMAWLVDEKVTWIGVGNKDSDITVENYEQILDCPYNSIFLKKALVGDSADNIKGVTGIGKAKFKKLSDLLGLANRQVKGKEQHIINITEHLTDKQKVEALHSLRLISPQEVTVDTKFKNKDINIPLLQGHLELYGMNSLIDHWVEEY